MNTRGAHDSFMDDYLLSQILSLFSFEDGKTTSLVCKRWLQHFRLRRCIFRAGYPEMQLFLARWPQCRFVYKPTYTISANSNISGIKRLEAGVSGNLSASKFKKLEMLDLRGISILTNAQALVNVDVLHLTEVEVDDYSAFGNQSELYLRRVNITHLVNLATIQKVSLVDCRQVTDISALSRVPDLALAGMSGKVDFSCLGGQTKLSLERCFISDVSGLGQVHSLSLSFCGHVNDVTALSSACILHVINCGGVIRFAAVGSHKELLVRGCVVNDVIWCNPMKLFLYRNRGHDLRWLTHSGSNLRILELTGLLVNVAFLMHMPLLEIFMIYPDLESTVYDFSVIRHHANLYHLQVPGVNSELLDILVSMPKLRQLKYYAAIGSLVPGVRLEMILVAKNYFAIPTFSKLPTEFR
jgi:hypothetical protein